MGFFGELKQDLSQAVNELMPDEEREKPAAKEENNLQQDNLPEDLNDILSADDTDNMDLPENLKDLLSADDTDDAGLPEGLKNLLSEESTDDTLMPEDFLTAESMDDISLPEDIDMITDEATIAFERLGITDMDDGTDRIAQEMEESLTQIPAAKQEGSETCDMSADPEEGDGQETSVIPRGLTITGDIAADGSINIIGRVNGNIDAAGKMNITGHVNGDSRAAEIYAEGARVNGALMSRGAIKIGAGTVVTGNITASGAAVAGAVKGDIDVNGPVVLAASAIVMGDIKCRSLQVNNGAIVEGMCSLRYADTDPATFFEKYIQEA